MKGEIVNVDGVGNRIAGSLYGADRIIVVAGVNKLVPDENAAREANPLYRCADGQPEVQRYLCVRADRYARAAEVRSESATSHRSSTKNLIESDFP